MLYILGLALIAFWAIALAFKVTVGVIHVALVLGVVLFVVGFLRGRTGGSVT